MRIEEQLEKIDRLRLADSLWRLVQIPSPTCQERQASLAFAEMLAAAGAEVELDEAIYDSPCVIGRLRGNRAGKILQLAGHIDHIDVPHDEPVRSDTIISGRGSYDMKNGLAAILEIVRVLKEGGCDFAGEILITVYGLHEEPGGNTRGIMGPISKGIKGDAAIVMEGPSDRVVTLNNGLARWDISINQEGAACHELNASAERDELQKTLLALINALRRENFQLENRPSKYPLLRKESLFIGQIHFGDFFNRVPTTCWLQGSRRWQPNRSFGEIEEELNTLVESIPCQPGVSIDCQLKFIGHSYEMSPEEPIVQSFLRSYKLLTKNDIEVVPGFGVCDAQRLVREAGVPAIPWGAESDPMHMGHTDNEYAELDKLQMACRIVLAAALDYLDHNKERP